MRGRSEAHDQQTRPSVAEPRNRLRPIIPVIECTALRPPDQFTPFDQSRTGTASDDLGVQAFPILRPTQNAAPSIFSSASLVSTPPGAEYPPNVPSVEITRWQGIKIGIGLRPSA